MTAPSTPPEPPHSGPPQPEPQQAERPRAAGSPPPGTSPAGTSPAGSPSSEKPSFEKPPAGDALPEDRPAGDRLPEPGTAPDGAPQGPQMLLQPALGASLAPYELKPETDPLGAQLRRGLLVAALVAVCGIVLGLFWLWLSPRVPMVSDGQAVYLKDTEGEEAVGGDGTFVLIALVLGVLTAAAVFWRCRKGGVAVVLGLAVGAALASVIGWRLGVWLGPTTDIVAHAKQVGPKVVFDGPLQLRAKSAIVAWPAAAMLVHAALTYAFGPREESYTGTWTE